MVSEVGHLGKVVTGVDHQQGVRNAAHAKGFFCTAQHDQGVLASRKQQSGTLKGRSDLAQDENRLLLQAIQVGLTEAVNTRGPWLRERSL